MQFDPGTHDQPFRKDYQPDDYQLQGRPKKNQKTLMNPLIDCDFCASPYARCRIYWISFGAGLSGKALLVQECVLEGEESEFLWQKDPLVLVQMLGS